ncbi:unnamed protein product [Camellia sinensis]
MASSYITWVHHGEQVPVSRPSVSNDQCGGSGECMTDIDDPPMDELPIMLEEIYVSGLMDGHTDEEPNGLEREDLHKFTRLFEDAQRKVYPTCEKFFVLSFVIKMLHVKVYNKWSNKSFDMVMQVFKDILPECDPTVPWTLYDAKKFLRDLDLGYETIHSCKNDCALFWKESANLEKCPTCDACRYKLNDDGGKKIRHKVLQYFPLTPRLKRLYMSKKTAADMRWHNEKRVDNDILRHPSDGEAWKAFDKQHPITSYSMWPVILMPYNLPPWKCMKEPYCMMSLLIPGHSAPGRDIDVYLQPLIEELKNLWEHGVQTYDASNEQIFRMHAAVMWTINDFPAYGNMSGWSTKGYLACPNCNNNALSQGLRSKIGYMGARRHLPENHTWRTKEDANILTASDKGVGRTRKEMYCNTVRAQRKCEIHLLSSNKPWNIADWKMVPGLKTGRLQKKTLTQPETDSPIAIPLGSSIASSPVFPVRSDVGLSHHVTSQPMVDSNETQAPSETQPSGVGTSKPLHVRGPTLGKGIQKIIRAKKGEKCYVHIDRGLNAMTGKYATPATNELGIQIRTLCPLKDVKSWLDLDETTKAAVIQAVLDKFQIGDDFHNDLQAQEIVNKKAYVLYKDWRYTLKQEFELLEGLPRDEIYAHPPIWVSLDDWKHMIDVAWQDASHQKRSKARKSNRSQLPYNHTNGSRSFPIAMAAMVAKNGELDFPKFYEDSHTSKKTNDWIHPKCRELHQEMVNVQAAAIELGMPLTQEEISRQVLGQNKRYLLGFGSGPQPSTIFASRAHDKDMEAMRA